MSDYSNPLDRIAARLTKTPTGCWTIPATSGSGYAYLRTHGRDVGAHRLVYESLHGPLPTHIMVCHTCDVRNCVNPHHIFAGSNADNQRDRYQKRYARLPHALIQTILDHRARGRSRQAIAIHLRLSVHLIRYVENTEKRKLAVGY